jgi:cobalt/nickel transport system permease protein
MAFVLPFVAYGVYRLLAQRMSLTSPKRALAAGIAGYVGINAAALCAAIEFGIQPDLFHTANGTPLYAPFHLSQTIPAMLLAHLTIAGLAEFAFTFGIMLYLQKANVPILRINHPDVPVTDVEMGRQSRIGWQWALVPLGLMIVLTPLGLLAPGGAFGEDAPQDIDLSKYGLHAVPTGLNRFADFWSHAVLGGYGFHSGDHPVIGYLVSATVGILIIGAAVAAVVWLIRLAQGSDKTRTEPHDDVHPTPA